MGNDASVRPRFVCRYCGDRYATVITRDTGEPLCGYCVRDSYTDLADTVSRLTWATWHRYRKESNARSES